MKVILIAAGMGTRLRPMTSNLPKCMAVQAEGKSLFDLQIEIFKRCGLSDIVVIRGYEGEKFTRQDVRYIWNHDFERNNILGSLMKAQAEFNDDLLISYSDIWFEECIPRRLAGAEGDIVLAVDTAWRETYEGRSDHPLSEAEAVEMGGTGRVQRIGKIADSLEGFQGEFTGMMKLSLAGAKLWVSHYQKAEAAFKGKPFMRAKIFEKAYLTDMLQYLIDQNIPVMGQATQGRWREIDTLQDFENLIRLLNTLKRRQ